jgi:hypothetical protein
MRPLTSCQPSTTAGLTLEQARESLYRTVLEADASAAARHARYRALLPGLA